MEHALILPYSSAHRFKSEIVEWKGEGPPMEADLPYHFAVTHYTRIELTLDATIALIIPAYFYDSAGLSFPYDLPRPYAHFHGYLSLSLYCDFFDALRRIQDPARFEYRIFGDRDRLFSEGDETNRYLTSDERKQWDRSVMDHLEEWFQDEKKEIREGKKWRIYLKGTRENPIWVEDDPIVVTSVVAGESRVPQELRSKLTSRSALLQPAAHALAIAPLPVAHAPARILKSEHAPARILKSEHAPARSLNFDHAPARSLDLNLAPARSLNSAPVASTSTTSPVRDCLTCSSELEHEIFSQTTSPSSQNSDDTPDAADTTDDFIAFDKDIQGEEVQLVGGKGKERMED